MGSDVGGYELGLVSDGTVGEGVTVYWDVEDIEAEYKRLLELGAKSHKRIEEVGGGIKVAVVLDPSGNRSGSSLTRTSSFRDINRVCSQPDHTRRFFVRLLGNAYDNDEEAR